MAGCCAGHPGRVEGHTAGQPAGLQPAAHQAGAGTAVAVLAGTAPPGAPRGLCCPVCSLLPEDLKVGALTFMLAGSQSLAGWKRPFRADSKHLRRSCISREALSFQPQRTPQNVMVPLGDVQPHHSVRLGA